jgi:hypothetical protein
LGPTLNRNLRAQLDNPVGRQVIEADGRQGGRRKPTSAFCGILTLPKVPKLGFRRAVRI